MGFCFPLATVLRIREITEQREERLLGQILSQIAQAHQTLSDIEMQSRNLLAQREAALKHSATGMEVVTFDGQLRQLAAIQVAGKEHLAQLMLLREKQIHIYEAAHRNRELLSSIKTTQLEEFQRLRAKQEQNAMDDNFSSRRNRR